MIRKLDLDSTTIIVYSDGSFGGNKDDSSQLGCMIFLPDKSGTANRLLKY